MSQPRFIFNTIDYQNSAITVNNYVNNVNAVNNAAFTGNSFKFRTDADRMKYLLGSKGQSRVSGYYNGLYANLYALTVLQNGSTLPSIDGPGSTGWGRQLWAGPIIDDVNIGDQYIQQRTGQSDYVGIQIEGYVNSDVATTVMFKITSDDGAAIYFNGVNVLPTEAWVYRGPTENTSAAVTLNAGYNPIRILYFEGGGGSKLTFSFKIGDYDWERNLSCGCFYNYRQL
jgi:hypothetical protein